MLSVMIISELWPCKRPDERSDWPTVRSRRNEVKANFDCDVVYQARFAAHPIHATALIHGLEHLP